GVGGLEGDVCPIVNTVRGRSTTRGQSYGADACAATRDRTVVFPRAHQYNWRVTTAATATNPSAIHTGSRNTSSRTPATSFKAVRTFTWFSSGLSVTPFRERVCSVVHSQAAQGTPGAGRARWLKHAPAPREASDLETQHG